LRRETEAGLEIATREDTVSSLPGDLERIFEAHHASVFRAAYRITGNATDAEDVLQTVFLRLLRNKAANLGLANPEAYLRRAAVNASLDVVRARRKENRAAIESVHSSTAAQDGELRDLLQRGIAMLSPSAAEVFALRFLEGYSNKEIARMLSVSQVRVAVTLHRARRQLRKEMGFGDGGRR
jgi:RNA polymerase sigma-70 factor (ECF subfamily)